MWLEKTKTDRKTLICGGGEDAAPSGRDRSQGVVSTEVRNELIKGNGSPQSFHSADHDGVCEFMRVRVWFV